MEWIIVGFMLVMLLVGIWLDAVITKPGKYYGPSNNYQRQQEDYDD